MKRSLPLLLVFAVLVVCVYNSFAQQVPETTVIGRVIDAETGEPLIGANVYIANTVLGSATNDNGEFIIFKVPYGVHRLISSYIGYQISNTEITVSEASADPINISMKPDALQSEEVLVTGERPKNWGYNLSRFKKYFIGTSKNAKECTILNPEVLDFEESGAGDFRAHASSLLKIENRALGYLIELQLEEFQLIGKQLRISYFPYYSDLDPENNEQILMWEEERDRAYKGSLRHFLKFLVEKKSELDRIKMTEDAMKNAVVEEDFNKIRFTAGSYNKAMEQIDNDQFLFMTVSQMDVDLDEIHTMTSKKLDILNTGKSYEKEIGFSHYLFVRYWDELAERNYTNYVQDESGNPMTRDKAMQSSTIKIPQISYLRIDGNSVIVNSNGVLHDPYSLISYGYMAWEGLADSVPNDYEPFEGNSDIFPVEFRPETKWFRSLDDADSTKFQEEFEYPIQLVLNSSEKKHYNGISTVQGRKGFIKRYIKSRNLNPLYAVNYWFLEYIGRYEHARDEFGISDFPYFDARGEYWIKFGKPYQRFKDPGGLKKSKSLNIMIPVLDKNLEPTDTYLEYKNVYKGRRSIDDRFMVRANESWNYDDSKQRFTVHFVKRGKKWQEVRDLEDVMEVSSKEAKTWGWLELIKERDHISHEYMNLTNQVLEMEEMIYSAGFLPLTGGRYEVVIPFDPNGIFSRERPLGTMDVTKFQSESYEKTARLNAEPNIADRFTDNNALEINYTTAQFRGPSGKTRIEMTALTPIRDLLDKRNTQDDSDSISAAVQVVVRDSMFEQLAHAESEITACLPVAEQSKITNLVGYSSVAVLPQTGDLTVQMMDRYSRNRGFKQQLIEIRDFTGQEPMISDIMFYGDKREIELLPTVKIDGIDLTPYPHIEIRRDRPVFCYFELYNLRAPGFGPLYEIELKTDSKKSRFGFVKKLFGGSGKVQLSMSQTRNFNDNDSQELIAIDISKLKPGEYTFTVEVTSQGQKRLNLTAERKIRIAK